MLRRQYRAALIDEFQDTDPLQYEIFRRVFAGPESHLFLIGDPKQAIYGFRGADIFTYLKASRQADQAYTLKENWRSESGLVRAVNTLSAPRPSRSCSRASASIPSRPKARRTRSRSRWMAERQPAFQLWFWRRTAKPRSTRARPTSSFRRWWRRRSCALLNGNDDPGRPQAAARGHCRAGARRTARPNWSRTRWAGATFPACSTPPPACSSPGKCVETQRVLAAIADPTHESQLLAALATDLLGYTGVPDRGPGEAGGGVAADPGALPRLPRPLAPARVHPDVPQLHAARAGPAPAAGLSRRRAPADQPAAPGGGAPPASIENRLGVAGLLKWIGEQREAEDQATEEHQLRLETDEKAVKLVTIHKSKGLEYPVVFCPFSWKGANIEHGGEEQVFFHEHGDGGLVRDLGSPDYEAHKQLARVERLAENVRLLYVALTRAKHRCYFVWGAFRDAATSAPAWLLHPPPSDSSPTPVAAQEAALPQTRRRASCSTTWASWPSSPQDADGQPAIEVQDLPEPTEDVFRRLRRLPAPALDYRKFTGAIARDWRISSFTSLTANQGEELPDHDELGACTPAPNSLPPASSPSPAGPSPAPACTRSSRSWISPNGTSRPRTTSSANSSARTACRRPSSRRSLSRCWAR